MTEVKKIDMDSIFKTTPRSYQLEAFDRFKNEKYFALLFDMGLGKSKTMIDILSYKFLKGDIDAVILIAPNGVHLQWIVEQLPMHCAVPYETFVWDSTKLKRKGYKAQGNKFFGVKTATNTPDPNEERKLKYFAINVEAFSSKTILKFTDYFTKKFNDKLFIILDESTKIKNPTALRTKAILKYNIVGQRADLTGTPAAKDPFALWAQFEFLHPNFFGVNYFVFKQRYGILINDKNWQTGRSFSREIGEKDYNMIKARLRKAREKKEELGQQIGEEDFARIAMLTGMSEKSIHAIDNSAQFIKYKNLDRLKSEIAPVTMSVRKADVADLPPKIYATSYVIMSPEQKSIYENLKANLRAQYASKELTVQNKLTLTVRLLQVCGGFFPYSTEMEGLRSSDVRRIETATGKLDSLRDSLEEVDLEQTKCIVWAALVPELLMLYEELSKDYSCCLYYGGVSASDRDKILTEFKEGKYDVFIANIATAGYGLNLQNATVQLYYSNNFRIEDRLQAEDRSHRIGVKAESVIYKDIVIKDTIDEACLKAIRMGKSLNDYFKDFSLEDILESGTDREDSVEDDYSEYVAGGVME